MVDSAFDLSNVNQMNIRSFWDLVAQRKLFLGNKEDHKMLNVFQIFVEKLNLVGKSSNF